DSLRARGARSSHHRERPAEMGLSSSGAGTESFVATSGFRSRQVAGILLSHAAAPVVGDAQVQQQALATAITVDVLSHWPGLGWGNRRICLARRAWLEATWRARCQTGCWTP